MWQDFVLTLANVAFMVSMIQAVRDKQKPPLTTSVPSAVALIFVCIVQLTLGLYLTTAFSFVIFCLWTVVGIQRYRQGKVKIVELD